MWQCQAEVWCIFGETESLKTVNRKWKAVFDEVEQLNLKQRKKKLHEADKETLLAAADNDAEKAEHES